MSNFGNGKVFVSGVHFEYDAKTFGSLLPYMSKNPTYKDLLRKLKRQEKNRRKLFNLLMEKIK